MRTFPLRHRGPSGRGITTPDIRVGVMGEPERSDPEFGRKVTEECVEALVELIKKMETAPEEGR